MRHRGFSRATGKMISSRSRRGQADEENRLVYPRKAPPTKVIDSLAEVRPHRAERIVPPVGLATDRLIPLHKEEV
jgi:hypothetical protein